MSRYDNFWPGGCPPAIMPPSPTREEIAAKAVTKHSVLRDGRQKIHFADGTQVVLITAPPLRPPQSFATAA